MPSLHRQSQRPDGRRGHGHLGPQSPQQPLLCLQLLPRPAATARVPLQPPNGRHLPSDLGRRRLLVLGAIRGQGRRGRHEVLLAPRLGLRRLPGSQAVSNLLVRPRRYVRGQWHRPLAAVFALGHSHVGQARPRGREQRFDRLFRQRPRGLGRRPGRQHCRLHQRQFSFQRHQHHQPNAPRVLGPVLLRAADLG